MKRRHSLLLVSETGPPMWGGTAWWGKPESVTRKDGVTSESAHADEGVGKHLLQHTGPQTLPQSSLLSLGANSSSLTMLNS